MIVYNYYTKNPTLFKSTDHNISMETYLEIIYGIIVDLFSSICIHISNADMKYFVAQYLTKSS